MWQVPGIDDADDFATLLSAFHSLQFSGDDDKYYPLCNEYDEVVVEGTLSIRKALERR